VTTVMVVVVAAFMAFTMRAVVTPGLSQSQQINYLIALAGGAVLLVAIVLLVSYGWAEDIAKAGLLLGLGLVVFAGMISVSVNATGIGPEIPYELFYPEEAVLETEWLQVTIDRTLVWNSRGFEDVVLVVAGMDSPGLHWALHAYDPLNFLPYIPPQSQPGILITKADVIPEISNSYQGQSLVWAREVAWQELTPKQYLTWLGSRDVPTTPLELILWVRTDLMPGNPGFE